MTFEAYVSLATRRRMLNRNERAGQAYWNTLSDVAPTLAEDTPVELDPFYDDAMLPAFLGWLAGEWPLTEH